MVDYLIMSPPFTSGVSNYFSDVVDCKIIFTNNKVHELCFVRMRICSVHVQSNAYSSSSAIYYSYASLEVPKCGKIRTLQLQCITCYSKQV